MRKVFTDDLPKWGKGGKAKEGSINWKESVGHVVKFVYDNIEGKIEIIDFYDRHLYVKYLDKTNFKIFTGSIIESKIGNLIGIYSSDFKVKIGETLINNRRNLTVIDREYRKIIEENGNIENNKWYKYKCNKCTYEGEIIESSLLEGAGCSCCCSNPKVVMQGINDIPTTAPWMVKFFQDGYNEAKLYTKNSGKRIYPICPDCGKIKEKSLRIADIYNKQSIGCFCSDGQSYPNKFMFHLLKQLNINFQSEYNPNWIKPKKYDFYFEKDNNKYIVEMDGGLGHGKKVHSSSNITVGESKEIDDYKDLKAKENGIEVIRIICDKSNLQYIKNNILNSNLNNIFDLSIVDWNKVEEFALCNLVKMACEIKRDNPTMTTSDIGKIIGLTSSAINDYLNKGSKIWDWVGYNPKAEIEKCLSKGRERKKEVQIFKDGKLLGNFNSATDLVNCSEKIYGIKLTSSGISSVCHGTKKTHQGFTFKYTNDESITI